MVLRLSSVGVSSLVSFEKTVGAGLHAIDVQTSAVLHIEFGH